MFNGPIKTVERICVNMWCMLDWIWSQNCRNTPLLHTAGQLVRAQKMGGCLYIQLGIRYRPDGAISDCQSWDISGNQLHNVLRGKKRATIVRCGLSVKRQLLCDLVRSHTYWSSENLNKFCSNRLLKNRILESWIQHRGIKCHFCWSGEKKQIFVMYV